VAKVTSIAGRLPKSWKPKSFILPKELGPCIDLLAQARQKRKKKEAETEEIKKSESDIKEHMLRIFKKQDIDGARGRLGSVSLVEKDVPQVKDKEAFGRYVARTKSWDLLYGKAVEEGCQARWEAGEQIDGVEKFHKADIRLNEAKGK
jgi:hypothetical protein